MLPNWIIHEWRQINMKTCANILSLCLPPPPTIAFSHSTNASAKILVILIFYAVVLFMAKRNMHKHIAYRECADKRTRTNFGELWFVFAVAQVKQLISMPFLNARILQTPTEVAGAKLRENFTLNIAAMRFGCAVNKRNELPGTTTQSTKSMAKCYLVWVWDDIIKAWSCFGCQLKWISLLQNPNNVVFHTLPTLSIAAQAIGAI